MCGVGSDFIAPATAVPSYRHNYTSLMVYIHYTPQDMSASALAFCVL